MNKAIPALLLTLSLLVACGAEAAAPDQDPTAAGRPQGGNAASSGATASGEAGAASGRPQTGGAASAASAISVAVAAPTIEDLSLTTDYIGTVVASESVSVYPKASGTVQTVYYDVGQTVRAGALLFSLDTTSLQQSIEKAELSYEKALNSYENTVSGSAVASRELQLQNTITQALRNYNTAKENAKLETDFDVSTYSKLRRAYNEAYEKWESGEGTIEELYEAEKELSYLTDELSDHNSLLTQLDNSFDSLEAARSELSLYQEQTKAENQATAELTLREAELSYQQSLSSLENYNIYAPISGVIESRSISQNSNASPGAAAFVISNRDVLAVEFNVSADGAAALSVGDEVTLTKGQATYSATVVEIDTKANASGLFPVKASLGGDSPLLPGVSVKVTATTRKAPDATVVSIDDISYDGDTPYVYCYRNGKAVRVELTLGITTRTQAQVLEGLLPEDEVITTWHPDLADGVAVTLKKTEA